uniref:tetratricopeptide repeat protein n=1 Tax=Actinotalea sp. C106 TaxID=2908644 RepID=UPI0035ABAA98
MDPRAYWLEGLRRDPGDARINAALGAALHRDGDYAGALAHLETALARLTARNPNPADGEASYRRGLALERLDRAQDAYDAFAKAAWDGRWAHAAQLQMAFLDAAAGQDRRALEVIETALRLDAEDLRARALEVVVLRRLGREQEAAERLAATLALDPLDPWNRDLAGLEPPADARVLVDVALDHAASGETDR